MRLLTLGTTATPAGSTPFANGWNVVGFVFGAINIQGSSDGTTYTTLVTGVAAQPTMGQFAMPAFVKLSAAGVGYLLGDA